MTVVQVSPKGQILIPKAIREKYGVKPGSRVQLLEKPDSIVVKPAAEIRSDYPISYADAFCVAVAQRSKGQILTSDPEFKSVQHLVSIVWLAHE